jgi:hypothetical protein
MLPMFAIPGCEMDVDQFRCVIVGISNGFMPTFPAFMMWLLFLTLPTGFIGTILYTIVVVVALCRKSS